MEINDRIAFLRKEILHETQEHFASKIGLARSTLGNMEKGLGQVTQRNIDAICNMYDVNQDWLVKGIGEIKAPRTKDDDLGDFFAEMIAENDTARKRFAYFLSRLSEEECIQLETIIDKYVEDSK